MSNIAWLPASDDGCAFYRMWLPYLRTPHSKYVLAKKGAVQYNDFSDCQIGIIQRLASQENYDAISTMKMVGMKLVYDLDDDMWSVQASNPAKFLLHQMENYERGFMTCSGICDLITVSTSRLKSAVEGQLGNKVPVKVIGNAVDLDVLRPSPVPRYDDRVVIGWAGSNTHIADLAQMGNTLDTIVTSQKKIYLHWIGMNPPGLRLRHHPRVNAHGWVPVKEFPARLSTWSWDIGVAPLENNRFNRSKSAIKMMELGALKTPCLCSDVQPYKEFVSHNRELEFLVCRTQQDWTSKLIALSEDKAMRDHYGQLMYDVVNEHYNMQKRARIWSETLATLR